MIFSNSKKLSKLLSLVLVLTLTAALFTGCFGKDKEAEQTEPNININLAETTEATEAETQPATTEPTEINENMGTVLSQLTIRSSPSTDATVVGTLYAGDKVEVQRRETVTGIEWAYIISPDAGWICMDFVEMDFAPDVPAEDDISTPAGATNPTEPEDDTSGETVNIKGVVSTGLNIRKEPGTTSDRVGSYNKGDVVTIVETKNGWGRTNKGWIKMEYVNTSTNTNTNTNTGTDKDKDTSKDDDKTTVNIVSNGSTTVQFRGVVTAKDLNIRADASQSADRVGSYSYGQRVEFLQKDGNWGRTEKGWVSLSYVYQDGTTGTNTANGVITGDGLNIRTGPGTDYGIVGSYDEGDSVRILEQFTYGKTTWGCTNKGWISMDYVDVDGDDDDDRDDEDDSDAKTGYVDADGLRIRSGPGTDYATVGTLEFGEGVTILDEVEDGNGVVWGKISSGWISMDYVELD